MRLHHAPLLSQLALALAVIASPAPARATTDGTWAPIATNLSSPKGRTYHSFALDTTRRRLMIFGGVIASTSGLTLLNDVWAYSLDAPEGWAQVQATGLPPSVREGAAMVYDPVRDRLLVFGGYTTNGASEIWLNDLWELSLSGTPQWTQLSATGTPPARSLAAFVYDPVGDRCILFGGSSPAPRNDTWQLALSGAPTWSPLLPGGTPPSARYETANAYDPVHGALLLFGGENASGVTRDTWALTLGSSPAWHQVPVTGARPAARSQARAVYDTGNNRFVIFGGSTALTAGTFFNDAWALSLSRRSSWLMLAPGGNTPAPRAATAIAFDAAASRLVIFGGVSFDGVLYTNFSDTWALSTTGGAWTLLDSGIATLAPPGREYHAAALDPARHRMIMFGGVNLVGGLHLWNDTWALALDSLDAWSNLQPAGTPPGPREGHLMVYDSTHDRMIVFGGYNLTWLNDVWALSLSGTPTWTQLLPGGQQPSPRSLVAGFYDPVRDRVLLFGGSADVYAFNDVYELSLAGTPHWSQLAPAGAPPLPRYAATGVYDAVRDRMILFGGINGNTSYNDTWSLELTPALQWTQLSPTGAPSPRSQCGGVVDTARDRMLLFAGSSLLTAGAFYNDAYALPLADPSAWALLAPAGVPPVARAWPVCVYDATGDRLVAFGGVRLDGSSYTDFSDTWSLAFEGSAIAEQQGAPARAIVNASADRVLALRARIGAPYDVALTTASAETPVVASVFDARGRLVWSQVVQGGVTTIALPRMLAQGVYVVRAEQGAHTAHARVVIAR